MKTTWRLWVYRHILALTLLVCHGLAALLLLALLALFPGSVLYLLDLISPITEAVRDFLWKAFPEAEWLRRAGKWMGAGVRWTFSHAQARDQAIGRLLLLDGMLLLTLMAWVLNRLLGMLVTLWVASWFDRRFVIVRREEHARHASAREPRFSVVEDYSMPQMPKGPPLPPLGAERRKVR